MTHRCHLDALTRAAPAGEGCSQQRNTATAASNVSNLAKSNASTDLFSNGVSAARSYAQGVSSPAALAAAAVGAASWMAAIRGYVASSPAKRGPFSGADHPEALGKRLASSYAAGLRSGVARRCFCVDGDDEHPAGWPVGGCAECARDGRQRHRSALRRLDRSPTQAGRVGRGCYGLPGGVWDACRSFTPGRFRFGDDGESDVPVRGSTQRRHRCESLRQADWHLGS